MPVSGKSLRSTSKVADSSANISLDQASAVVERAVIELLRKEPFYAHLLTSLKRRYSTEVPTAAVSATGTGATLWINPAFFCNELRDHQRVAVLKHEMLHLLFKHPWRNTSNMPDHRLRNIAADLVVNQFVTPWKLPDGAILLSSFPDAGLQADQTMEWYYDKLRQWSMNSPEHSKIQLDAAYARFSHQGCDSKWGEKGSDNDRLDSQGDHASAAAESVVRRLVDSARFKLNEREWGNLPSGVQRMVEDICAPPKLPWRRLLRLFAGRGTRTTLKTTRLRESSRFPGQPGVRIKRLQKIVVAIDTSGSIDDEILGEFLVEINGIARAGAEVTLVECDCKIQTVTKLRSRHVPQFKGGGGTDFDPVMQWLKDNRHENYGGCIYLTDGIAAKPKINPCCPILWVITPYMKIKHGWDQCGQ